MCQQQSRVTTKPAALGLFVASYFSVAAMVMADTEPREVPANDISGPTENQRIYRTREEQREAGLQTEILPWLTVSGLLEGEIQTDRFIPRDRGAALKTRSDSATLQLEN
ncbi:MAG: hypothetical protein PVI97_20830 [Candidatus Thiodiazotropha sp.]|jgi:hypothetical protein